MKRLSFTEADKAKLIEEFTLSLQNFKSNQEKFTFEKKFSEMSAIDTEKIKKPIIYFAMEAWIKMIQLVKACDKEIAWQATVEKRKFKGKENTDDFFYYIKQVFVYPQKVTGTFVDTNEVKYAEWSLQLEDEVYNSLRFQGHSHVNMGVGPSGTDLNTYQNFLDQLDKDDFYIFMILNKRNEFNIMVYDYAQDMLFETKDCYVDILTSQGSLTKWTEENMKQVEYKQTQPTTRWWEEEDRHYYCNSTSQSQPQSKITFANETGYVENGTYHAFKDDADMVEFFCDHPECLDKAALRPSIKKTIMNFLNKEETTPTYKKRGRPPKGKQ